MYAELTGRNRGFLTQAEQDALRCAPVFICGIGGMGGACLNSLARAGVTRFGVADPDAFEVSNLNRQVFAFLSTVGCRKVEATGRQLRDINPEIDLETYDANWPDELDGILAKYPVVVNGMDDVARGVLLYRKAREHRATVIDAYTSPLPSVTVVRPTDPRPEDRLRYPTATRELDRLTPDLALECVRREVEYVLTHSSSARHLDLSLAAEVLAGIRPRMSFAPPVIITGNLMALEVINLILQKPSGTDHRGYFFNPWTARVERPRGPVSARVLGFAVRRALARLAAPGETGHV